MEYEIIQHEDDIEVFSEGKDFLKVIRRTKWNGSLISRFYKEDTMILESRCFVFAFYKDLSISYQAMKENMTLIKRKGTYYLAVGDDEFRNKYHFLKNPVYSLLKNNEPCGEVYAVPFGFSLPPFKFKAVFKESEGRAIFALLMFLIDLDPIMS